MAENFWKDLEDSNVRKMVARVGKYVLPNYNYSGFILRTLGCESTDLVPVHKNPRILFVLSYKIQHKMHGIPALEIGPCLEKTREECGPQ